MNAVSSASPTKVLVVEDDPATVDFVRLYLERDGHEVFYALDGLEGLRLAREEKPDLIVLDIMLPKLDGMEIYPALRAARLHPIEALRYQ